MSRVQLALNVGDLDAAIDHYTKMFGVGPAKVRDGYANFAVENPPLKLVLISGHGEPGTLNHVGVEVFSTDEVVAKTADAQSKGLPVEIQETTTCCFAVQDKVWVKGGELPWEWYTVLEDAPNDTSLAVAGVANATQLVNLGVKSEGSCCGPSECC